jgi:hypothetical protein
MCAAIYAMREPPEQPECGACRVELRPENEEAAAVFMLCRSQVITIGEHGQPIDVNIQAVKVVMDLHGVTDQKTCLHRVRSLWHAVEAERRKRAG